MRKVDSSEEGNKHSRANNSHAFYPLTCSLGPANKLTSSYRKDPNFFRAKAPYLTVVSFCKTYTAISRKVVADKKMCTRQSRKVTERRSGIRLLFAGYSRNSCMFKINLLAKRSSQETPAERWRNIVWKKKLLNLRSLWKEQKSSCEVYVLVTADESFNSSYKRSNNIKRC